MAHEDHRNQVTIGREDDDEHLTVQTQPAERPERAIQVAYLEPISARGDRICIGAEPVTIGRSRTCTVQLDDPRVSGRHLLVLLLEGGVLVKDLGSMNGTFVDGHRVAEQMRVTTGAFLTLGRTSFHIRIGDDELMADGGADISPWARLERLTKDLAVSAYQNSGNLSHAARLIGFDRHSVRDWLRERGVYREPHESSRTTKR
jgi:hypothetical protein